MSSTDNHAPEFQASIDRVQNSIDKLLAIGGKKTANMFHHELGAILWEHVGMSRSINSLTIAKAKIAQLRSEFWENLLISGGSNTLNRELELAGRVADFLELGELMADDALARNESCGCHFREEFQTPAGEAQRNDEDFRHVAVWEYAGATQPAILHREPLLFNNVRLSQRVYQ